MPKGLSGNFFLVYLRIFIASVKQAFDESMHKVSTWLPHFSISSSQPCLVLNASPIKFVSKLFKKAIFSSMLYLLTIGTNLTSCFSRNLPISFFPIFLLFDSLKKSTSLLFCLFSDNLPITLFIFVCEGIERGCSGS